MESNSGIVSAASVTPAMVTFGLLGGLIALSIVAIVKNCSSGFFSTAGESVKDFFEVASPSGAVFFTSNDYLD